MLHVLEAVQFGTVRHLAGIVRFVDVEHHVVIPPPGGKRYTDTGITEQMWTDGARPHLVTMRRSPVDPVNAAAIARVRGVIRRERPDVVHGHSSIGGAVARLAAAGTGVATCYTPNGLFPGRAADDDGARPRPFHRPADRGVAVGGRAGPRRSGSSGATAWP